MHLQQSGHGFEDGVDLEIRLANETAGAVTDCSGLAGVQRVALDHEHLNVFQFRMLRDVTGHAPAVDLGNVQIEQQ